MQIAMMFSTLVEIRGKVPLHTSWEMQCCPACDIGAMVYTSHIRICFNILQYILVCVIISTQYQLSSSGQQNILEVI